MRFAKYYSAVAFLTLCFNLASAAGGKCGENVTWELDSNGLLTISGEGDMKDYGSGATPWRPELVKSLEIKDGIRRIGNNSFPNSNITIVVLPSSVTTIGNKAFKGCKYLASVTIPYGISTIGNEAFQDCISLSKILLPASLTMIGEKAFANCKNISELSIPSRVKSLGRNAFAGCVSVSRIGELPDYITALNSASYGLTPAVVDRYYETVTQEREDLARNTDVESQHLSASASKTQSSRSEGLSYGKSDVDAPMTPKPQNNGRTFALIFANEHYGSIADVPYAHNDGNSFSRYCTDLLGLPAENVNLYEDATWGTMKGALSYLKDIDDAFKGDINVIVYYAGHGSPSDDTQEAFLVPVDAAKVDKHYCYALNDFYKELSELKANSVMVFLDACFSGAARDNNMVEKARKVATVPKVNPLKGNLVVVSAASDDQTAWQYDSQGHGLFTYFMLKKLRESKGDVTLGELIEYINSKVVQTSVVVNRKRQNPSVSSSRALGDRWRSWTIK